MNLKKLVWRITPQFSHRLIRYMYFFARLLPNVLYDMQRYLAYSGLNRSLGRRGERAARIVLSYHQLEKGLSLAAPRPGFGADAAKRLLSDIETFAVAYGVVPPATTGFAVLREYLAFQDRAGHDASAVRSRYMELMDRFQVGADALNNWSGGAVRVRRTELDRKRNGSFVEFFTSRHSVRHFTGGTIPDQIIREAVRIAQMTPSVCNRQSWRVHAFYDRDMILRLLEIQAGNRGFGDQSSVVLIITCDLTSFVDVAERYQAWIDGGMFSMSLCLALHALGYGTCCLNWSKERADDRRLREAAKLPATEQVIMLLAVGCLPDEFQVACSSRLEIDQVVKIHH